MPKVLVTITDQATGSTMLISTDRKNLAGELAPNDNEREPVLEAVAGYLGEQMCGFQRSYDKTSPAIAQMFRMGNHIVD